MSAVYQGHCADGSSIQKHSVGDVYPFIVGKREGAELPWFVLSPEGTEAEFALGAQAFASAAAMKVARRATPC
jgi:hypothetical protein